MKPIKGICIECRKWNSATCSVYKQENKRPAPADWCAAYKKKK